MISNSSFHPRRSTSTQFLIITHVTRPRRHPPRPISLRAVGVFVAVLAIAVAIATAATRARPVRSPAATRVSASSPHARPAHGAPFDIPRRR